MKKYLLNYSASAFITLLIPASLDAQNFGPVQHNPFGVTTTGNNTTPAFADLDADGDLDMLSGDADGNFYYFENAGTVILASFNPAMLNAFGLTDIGDNSYPSFADLDADGDLDLMCGEQSGGFFYFENIGTSIAPAFGPVVSSAPFGLIGTPSVSSTLDMADLDNDGDIDLIAGESSGTLSYFENTGTSAIPSFAAYVPLPFGLTTAGNNAAPSLVDMDGDSDFDIIAGNMSGDFYYFENAGTISAPAFAASVINPLLLTNVGTNSTTTLADMNGDGLLDLMSGEVTNGYYYFERTTCFAPAAPTDTTAATNLIICAGTTTTLYATGSGTIGWYDAPSGGTWLGGGTSFTTPVLTDTITFYAQDSTCSFSATRTGITVIAYLPNVFISGNDTICFGQNTILTGNGASTYVWAAGPSTPSYTVAPSSDASFSVTGTDTNGCVNSDTILVKVNALPIISITGTLAVCANESTTLTASGGHTYLWSSGPSTPSYTIWPTSSGPYTVTGIDTITNCYNNATVTVTALPLPDVTVIPLGSFATVTNFTADSYLWVFCPIYLGAFGTNDAQAYLAVVNADYACIITDNGCTDTSDCVALTAIGINENVAADDIFSVYPNPASSEVTINSNSNFTAVNIVDVNGKTILSQQANTSKLTLNVAEIQNGFYFVQLINEGSLLGTHKLVVEK